MGLNSHSAGSIRSFFFRFSLPEIYHFNGKSMLKKFIAEIMRFLFQLEEQMRLLFSEINGFIAVYTLLRKKR